MFACAGFQSGRSPKREAGSPSMICAQRDLCRIEWMHCATDVRAAMRAISGFLCGGRPATKRRRNPGVARYLPERWQQLIDGSSRGTDMTLLFSVLRIALVIYVAAGVALYGLHDRLFRPPVSNLFRIRVGHFAELVCQPCSPVKG